MRKINKPGFGATVSCAAALLLGVALATGARAETLAEATGEHLSGAQIEQMLLNGTIQGKNQWGNPYTVTYGEGGEMSGVAGKNDEYRDTGKWWIEGDRFCRQYKEWLEGKAACLDVVHEDGIFKWHDTDGKFLSKDHYVPN